MQFQLIQKSYVISVGVYEHAYELFPECEPQFWLPVALTNALNMHFLLMIVHHMDKMQHTLILQFGIFFGCL